MNITKYPLSYHLLELKKRFIRILMFFIGFFITSYFFKENLYQFLVSPLIMQIQNTQNSTMIYTNLTEVFFSYLKLSFLISLNLSLPFIGYQIYQFSKPGLYKEEKKILAAIIIFSLILYFIGLFFSYYLIIPKAWQFFLGFQSNLYGLPLLYQAKFAEYIDLSISIMLGFGIAFQLPIVILLLYFFNLISIEALRKKRRFATVMIFILGGILTPPDIFSQFALAIPMLFLYEISIIFCKVIKKKVN